MALSVTHVWYKGGCFVPKLVQTDFCLHGTQLYRQTKIQMDLLTTPVDPSDRAPHLKHYLSRKHMLLFRLEQIQGLFFVVFWAISPKNGTQDKCAQNAKVENL